MMVESVTNWPHKQPQGMGTGGDVLPPVQSTEALAKCAKIASPISYKMPIAHVNV